MIVHRNGRPAYRVCNATCASSFQADRRVGLVYPALHVTQAADPKHVGVWSVEQFSLAFGTCVYCDAQVPGKKFDLNATWPATHSVVRQIGD